MSDIVFGIRLKSDSRELAGDMARARDEVDKTGRAAKQSFGQAELSAKQMQAAMRGLPAQFTDIFTSLASGQAPVTVLLQQGGQLKDMFGGIGPAARAMGGYVAGIINPLTLAGTAVAALATAWAQGDAESARYRTALALTGHAAGVTAGELQAMAKAAADAAGTTQGSAAAVMIQLAESGRVAADVMPQVGAAIAAMSRTGTVAAEDLVKAFAEIAKDPVEGVAKLNAAYNLLEPAILAQVASLKAQGREEEAVALAQTEAAKAVDVRAREVEASLGTLQRAWAEVRDFAALAWDAMRDIGREDNGLAAVQAAVAELASLRATAESAVYSWTRDAARAEIAQAEADLKALLIRYEAEQKRAEAGAQRKADNEALAASLQKVEEIEARAARQTRTMADALAGYRAELEVIRQFNPNSVLLDPRRIAEQEAKIRASFETTRRGARQAKPAVDEMAKALDKWYDTRQKGLDSLDDEIEAERAAREAMGKSRAEVLEMEAAKLDLAAASKDVEAATIAEAAAAAGALSESYRIAAADAEKLAAKMRELAAEKRATAGAVRAEEREKAEEKLADKAIAEQRRAAEASASFWTRIYDDVGRGLTDAIFEGGTDGWELLKRSIESTFIRAYVQPIMTQGVAAIGQTLGFGPGSAASAGGQVFGGASVSDLGYLNNVAGLGVGNAAGTAYAQATGTGLDGLLSTNGAYGTAQAGSATYTGAGSFGNVAGGIGGGYYFGQQLTGNAVGGAAGAAAGYYAAASIPYVGWVLAIAALLDSMGVFGSDGPHQGGAAFSTIGGASGLADPTNTPDFNLSWGAYRATRGGDRSAGVDEFVSGLLGQVSESVAERAARYGGDASGVRLTGRYAVDPDDGRGAYRVQDASGATVFERYRDYGSADDASQQFAADALRAEIAALQSSDLGEWFADIVGVVDPLADSLDVLTQALAFADEVALQSAEAERVRALGQRDALEDARIAGLSAASAWFHSGEVIRDAAAAGALSVGELSQLAAEHYAKEVRLLTELARASEQVAGMFSDTAASLKYQALATDQARYAYLQAEADQILDVISGLLDPDEIVRQSQRLQQVVGRSFGLLDEDQKAAELPDFLSYLADANTYIQDRIDLVTDTVVESQEQTNDALADAMIAGIGRATEVFIGGMERAAAAIPSNVNVRVTVIQPPAPPGQQAPIVHALGDGG